LALAKESKCLPAQGSTKKIQSHINAAAAIAAGNQER
jgi:hypothetical protein